MQTTCQADQSDGGHGDDGRDGSLPHSGGLVRDEIVEKARGDEDMQVLRHTP